MLALIMLSDMAHTEIDGQSQPPLMMESVIVPPTLGGYILLGALSLSRERTPIHIVSSGIRAKRFTVHKAVQDPSYRNYVRLSIEVHQVRTGATCT